jgi:hypothetical protein
VVKGSDLADPLQREGRLGERQDRDPKQRQRVVVSRAPVQVDLIAPGAPVDEDPLATTADGDADGLHQRTAVGSPITGRVVDVTTPQAGWAVVPVRRSERVIGDVESAMTAAERLGSSSIAAASLI